jgi:hypothetical protein
MNRQLLTLLLGLVIAMNAAHAQPRDAEMETPCMNVFWSGHSLTDPPIPEFVAEIAGGFGTSMQWNRHSMAGASLEARTRGRPPSETGGTAIGRAYNRDTENMDVIAEFRRPRTIRGERYDVLVITEVHNILWPVLKGDTVRLLRHYYERFHEGNPEGRTFFYEAWLGINDKDDPQPWIEYERAASPIWQCVATRVNTSLEFEGRSDRIASLPAGLALARLVERAIATPGCAGDHARQRARNAGRLVQRRRAPLAPPGAYFVALVSYAFLFDASPVGAWAPDDVTPAQADVLQREAAAFVSEYRASNRPLTLEECSALVRDSFADAFWRYIYDGYRRPGDPWLRARLARTKHTAERLWHTYNWRRGFADDASENPFRFDPASDGAYWHPAP